MTIQAIPSFRADDQTIQDKKNYLPAAIGGAVATTAAGAATYLLPVGKEKFEGSTDVAIKALEESQEATQKAVDEALSKVDDAFKVDKTYIDAQKALADAKTERAKFTFTPANSAVEGSVDAYTFNGNASDKTAFETAEKAVADADKALKGTDFAKVEEYTAKIKQATDDKAKLTITEDAATKAKTYEFNGKKYTAAELTTKVDGKRTMQQIINGVDAIGDNKSALEKLRLNGLADDAAQAAVKANQTKLSLIKGQLLELKPGGDAKGAMPGSFKEIFEKIKKGEAIADGKAQEKEIVEKIMSGVKKKNAMIYGGVGLAVGAAIVIGALIANNSANKAQ